VVLVNFFKNAVGIERQRILSDWFKGVENNLLST
jgi:hypothetical protein